MVYIPNLKKNLFPLYIPPEADELLSSWICRNAYNHQVKTNTFFQNYFPEKTPIWNRDIDVSAPQEILKILERHTPLSTYNIDELLLKSYEGYAFEILNLTTVTPNILSLGIKHRLRIGYGQQCCPKCLDKPKPYYKKSWRLASSIMCIDCDCFLIDRCPNCEQPITFYRINMGGNKVKSTMEFESMNLCSSCRADLSNSQYQTTAPTSRERDYQKFLDLTIQNGYNNIADYSFTYLQVLFLLSLRLRRDTQSNRLKDYIEKRYRIKFESYSNNIFSWDINQRKDTFPFVFNLMKNYPYKMQKILKEGKVMRAYLIKGNQELPYWFEKLLHY